jgi:hypothetical protein
MFRPLLLSGIGCAALAVLAGQLSTNSLARDSKDADGPRGGSEFCAFGTGPDVIVGRLYDPRSYGSSGGISAFAIGTISCNLGDTNLSWVSSNNQHPVIGQHMYRINNGRIEMVGQSWLKHGFAALAGSECCTNCNGAGSGLGVGCSDPYSGGLNGSQGNLGPKYEVNAFTGFFQYPPADPSYSGNVARRLQVKNSDLDPGLDGGGTYLVEGHYVTPDDAAAGNNFNNVSYAEAFISGSGSSWSISGLGATQREMPAIEAWPLYEPAAQVRKVQVPGEGMLYLGWKITSLGGDDYEYEFAVYNMNSDRSVGGFEVPFPVGTNVQTNGFHDVNYHSGEAQDGTDWQVTTAGDFIAWDTELFSVNQDANAIRWGTLYNFRFTATLPKSQANAVDRVILHLFKPGTPDFIEVPLIGNAPVNDECSAATFVTNGSTAYSTLNATTDGPEEFGPCSKAGYNQLGSDVWFRYTASCTGDVTVSTCDADFDTKLAAYFDCPTGSGELITCNDDSCGTGSEITFAATQGVEYLIRLGGHLDATGSGTLTIDCDPLFAVNDNCVNAIPVGNGSFAFDTTDATTDGPAHPECVTSDDGGQTYHDIWYRYTALCPGTLTVSTCDNADYDTDLVIYDGTDCSNLVLLGCEDDTSGCGGFTSTLSVDVIAGNEYLIRVGGWNEGDQGTGTLTIQGPVDCGVLVNDLCANAIPIFDGDTQVDTTDAETDGPAHGTCAVDGDGGQTYNDIWFRYTATCTGDLTISTCDQAQYDTDLVIYDGTDCNDLQFLGCNDDGPGCANWSSELVAPVVAGDVYLIRVGGWNTGSAGTALVTISCDGIQFVDCNNNGIDDAMDISQGTSPDCNNNNIPDECDLASGVATDCDGGPIGDAVAGWDLWNSLCINCHGDDGSGGFGPNIIDYDRTQIWDVLAPAVGDHPGGQHPEYTQQTYANLERWLNRSNSTGARPDLIPDSCQTGTFDDCDNDGQSDACELAAGSQVDFNKNGRPDDCECASDIDGSGSVGTEDFFSLLQNWGLCPDNFLPCPHDIAPDNGDDTWGDGMVGTADFFRLLQEWGDC